MTNLFSTKQIVGICFLIIGVLVYTVTGSNFNISLLSMELPDTNPFKDPCEGCTYIKKQLISEARSFEQLISSGMSADTKFILAERKATIDSASCSGLRELYNNNPRWALKPYVAYRLIEVGCDV